MAHHSSTSHSSHSSNRRFVRIAAVVVVSTAVLGLIGWRLSLPPANPPDYSGERPELADAGDYASVTHSVYVNASPEHVWAAGSDPDLSLEDIVQFDDSFPAVETTQPLIGDWTPGDRVGDRRWVRFEDGHYLAEEVLIDDPNVFRYQIWGFTRNVQRFSIQHGVAEFRYEPEGGGTRLSWTYSLLPTTSLLSGPVQSFLDSTMTPMMIATLDGTREHAEATAQDANPRFAFRNEREHQDEG